MSDKRQPLREFLTEEYIIDCLNDDLNIQGIADRTKEVNGGTCSVSTVHYWMKQYGLVPDVPRKKIKIGIKPEKVIRAYQLTQNTEPNDTHLTIVYEGLNKADDVAVLISDVHVGACATAQGYDPIPQESVEIYITTFCNNLIDMFAKRKLIINTLHLFLLGDIVDGEHKFPSHKSIDMGRQLRIAVWAMRTIIETLRPYAVQVVVHTVAGNHGMITKTHHRASNWDNVVYDTLGIVYEEVDGVWVDTDRSFVKVSKVGKWRILYTHGDIIGGMITRKKASTKSDGFHRRTPHDMMIMGHFHTTMYMNYNRMPIITNGCMYDSDLIQNELAGWECKRMIVFKLSDGDYPVDWLEMIDVE